ncbi:hypothetical protein [Arthrobacter woluwensis]|uniref:hypothetical protein n=1 Tax=Arthrobacter woluwensis TaxID=156980 RepID=UPI0011A11694|nr:hypothetical protein [Arthrobacter woluwensis]
MSDLITLVHRTLGVRVNVNEELVSGLGSQYVAEADYVPPAASKHPARKTATVRTVKAKEVAKTATEESEGQGDGDKGDEGDQSENE